MKKAITLIDLRNDQDPGPRMAFEVKEIKNSTSYYIGQAISKGEGDNLCKESTYDVKIIGKKPQ